MNYCKKIILFILLLLSLNTKEQIIGTNLVQNPSFEQFYSCPLFFGQLNYCKYWWGLSTDYFNTCSSNNQISVPLNFDGFQLSHSGNAYAGFFNYASQTTNHDWREAIKTSLNDSLISNQRYCTKFYISLANGNYPPDNYLFLDSIGMLFTKDSIQDSALTPILSNGIKVQNNIFNIDTINWFEISNSFIANGGERYLTIGNFDITINYPSGESGFIYIYVDDVSVCECAYKINLGNDTTLCQGEAVLLNASLQGANYIWQDGSTNSTFLATQPGKYKVTAYIKEYNIIVSDSINITYDGDCLKIPNIFTPNGDGVNDYFVIQNTISWNINLQVYNRWGNIVYQNNNYQNNWDGKDVAYGVYYYIIVAKNNLSGFEKQYHGSVTILR